jgi:hypothetical protein
MRPVSYKILLGFGFTMALLGTVNFAQAQTEKGQLIIGGSCNISESIQSTTTTFNLALGPTFGAFVVRNFAIAGSYSFSVGSTRTFNAVTDVHSSTTTITTLVGPMLKYYIGKKTIKPFVSANGGYSVYTQIRTNSLPGSSAGLTNYDGFSFGGSVGVAYFFNTHISLETALYSATSGYQTQIPTTRFGLSLGLYAFLDKKKAE